MRNNYNHLLKPPHVDCDLEREQPLCGNSLAGLQMGVTKPQ